MLLAKNSVEQLKGEGVLRDRNIVQIENTGQTLSADNVLIATGARERDLQTCPLTVRL